jgi:hypothetical protein
MATLFMPLPIVSLPKVKNGVVIVQFKIEAEIL